MNLCISDVDGILGGAQNIDNLQVIGVLLLSGAPVFDSASLAGMAKRSEKTCNWKKN